MFENLSSFGSGLLALVILAYAAEFALSLRDDAREPQRVRPTIPLIGHVIGLVRHGVEYCSQTKYAVHPSWHLRILT